MTRAEFVGGVEPGLVSKPLISAEGDVKHIWQFHLGRVRQLPGDVEGVRRTTVRCEPASAIEVRLAE